MASLRENFPVILFFAAFARQGYSENASAVDRCGGYNPFSLDEQSVLVLLKAIRGARVVKIFVDLRDDVQNATFSPGLCPSGSHSEDEAGVPLTWAFLDWSRYSVAYLSLPVCSLRLFSMTTFNRYTMNYYNSHIRVVAVDPCWKKLSYDQAYSYMADAVQSFRQLVVRLKGSDLRSMRLCFRHPITKANRSSPLFSPFKASWRFRCCRHTTSGNDSAQACETDLGDTTLDVADWLSDAIFVIVVLFACPVLPLRVLKALITDVKRSASQRQAKFIVAETGCGKSEPASCAEEQFKLDDETLPEFLCASVVLSKPILGAMALFVYFFVFIAWPFVSYNALLSREVRPEDSVPYTCDAERGEPLFHNTLLALSGAILVLPVLCLSLLLARNTFLFEFSSATTKPDQPAGCDVKDVWSLVEKLADGSVQPQPLSTGFALLCCTARSFLRSVFIEPFLFVRVVVAAFAQRSIFFAIVFSAILLPVLTAFILLLHLVVSLVVLLIGVFHSTQLIFQCVPLFRLASCSIICLKICLSQLLFRPLTGHGSSILAFALALLVSLPLFYGHFVLCRQLISYGFFTILGLLINYPSETIAYGSILSSLLLEARAGLHSLYTPLLAAKQDVARVSRSYTKEHENVPTSLLNRAAYLTFLDIVCGLFATDHGQNVTPFPGGICEQQVELCASPVEGIFGCLTFRYACAAASGKRGYKAIKIGSYKTPVAVLIPRLFSAARSHQGRAHETEAREVGDTTAIAQCCHTSAQQHKESVATLLVRERLLAKLAKGFFQAIILLSLLCFFLEFDVFWTGPSSIMQLIPLALPIWEISADFLQRKSANLGATSSLPEAKIMALLADHICALLMQ